MPRSYLLILACVLDATVLPAGPGYAATATLVRDIDGTPRVLGSRPRDFVALGEQALFVATTPEHDDEPWVTDGTAAGTHLLKDLEPGPDDLESGGIRCVVAFGSGALLLSPTGARLADDGRAMAVWRTDGTTERTVELARVAGPGACAMAALGDRVVFTVVRREPDRWWVLELWTSDATPAGTQRLASFRTEYFHSTPLQRAGDVVFFMPRTESGVELWRTDGSAARTRRVSNTPVLSGGSEFLGALGGLVFFPGGDAMGTQSLWRSDGSAAGTFALAEAPVYGGYRLALSTGGHLLLASADGVWVTNGRRDGTTRRAAGLSVIALAAVGDSVSILDVASGTRLWRWEDLRDEPTLVAEIPGTGVSRHAVLPGILLFLVVAPDGTRQLWRSDGTPGGTGVVATSSLPDAFDSLGVSGARAFFPADGSQGDLELWSSDGTAAGTALLANLAADDVYTDSSDPRDLHVVGDRVIFTAVGGAGEGRELWASDGSADGTALLHEFNAGRGAGVAASNAVEFDGALFLGLASNRPDVVSGLWRTDGTAAGTTLAVPLMLPRITRVVAAGDALYFSTDTPNAAVCRTRGSEADTTCGPSLEAVGEMRAFGERVIFSGGPSGDQEPWISDGTLEGTQMIGDLRPGRGGSAPRQFTTLGGDAVFVASPPDAGGQALWQTDGTARGTRIRFSVGDDIQALTAVGGRLFFVVVPFYEPASLWTGTEEGFQRVAEVTPTAGFGPGAKLPRLGRSVLFGASDAVHGSELWISDGTPAGTGMVRDLLPGPGGSTPYAFRELGDRVAFVACADSGCEPWITDGTSAGTSQLADIAPGIASSDPSEIVAVGGSLHLVANDRVRGRELWRIALDAGCAGDCGGDGEVSIADAITAVAIALGARPAVDCAAADADADGSVTINELVAAVRAALMGCQSRPAVAAGGSPNDARADRGLAPWRGPDGRDVGR